MAEEVTPAPEAMVEEATPAPGAVAEEVTPAPEGASAEMVSGAKESLDTKELRCVFNTVDADADGKISRQELANFIRKLELSSLTEKQIDAILHTYDVNKSGYLEYNEFLKLHHSLMECDGEGNETMHDEELLRDAFNVFDRNKDGLISPAELQLIVQALDLGKGNKEYDFSQMIKAVDTDGDGFVDIKEFRQLMIQSFQDLPN